MGELIQSGRKSLGWVRNVEKSGDLQWRILHGAVAVNAFISVINPSVNDKCVFCGLREMCKT